MGTKLFTAKDIDDGDKDYLKKELASGKSIIIYGKYKTGKTTFILKLINSLCEDTKITAFGLRYYNDISINKNIVHTKMPNGELEMLLFLEEHKESIIIDDEWQTYPIIESTAIQSLIINKQISVICTLFGIDRYHALNDNIELNNNIIFVELTRQNSEDGIRFYYNIENREG